MINTEHKSEFKLTDELLDICSESLGKNGVALTALHYIRPKAKGCDPASLKLADGNRNV